MINISTLFLVLFVTWILYGVISDLIIVSTLFIISGFVLSGIISLLVWKLRIINTKTQFLFLQFGFYKYIFHKINESFFNVFRMAFAFLKIKQNFNPALDYIFLNKDDDSEIALCVNIITSLPGTICVAIKKRYIVVHSLHPSYFSLSDMYAVSSEINSVYDDSLI